jgi:hypothetical protein
MRQRVREIGSTVITEDSRAMEILRDHETEKLTESSAEVVYLELEDILRTQALAPPAGVDALDRQPEKPISGLEVESRTSTPATWSWWAQEQVLDQKVVPPPEELSSTLAGSPILRIEFRPPTRSQSRSATGANAGRTDARSPLQCLKLMRSRGSPQPLR